MGRQQSCGFWGRMFAPPFSLLISSPEYVGYKAPIAVYSTSLPSFEFLSIVACEKLRGENAMGMSIKADH